MMRGYRGYQVEALWVNSDPAAYGLSSSVSQAGHWVIIVSFRGSEVDRFLNLDEVKTAIDGWLNAR